MNLQKLTDAGLIQETGELARQERELLSKVLHCFREIERRRLFSSLGYRSLFEMAVKHFGYSEDQAYRRISAMKLLRELPEVELKIQTGELNLTHLSLAHSLFRHEKKASREMPKDVKLQLLEQVSGQSTRDAEKIVHSHSSAPQTLSADRVKTLSVDHIELKFTANLGLQAKIEKLKGMLAHSHPDLSFGELFEKLCDLGLQEWNPASPAAPRKRRVIKIARRQRHVESKAQTRRDVYLRAQNQCENCGSEYRLEIDHVHPKAKGGLDSPENLRLLCKPCNQRAAIESFGLRKMNPYLNNSQPS